MKMIKIIDLFFMKSILYHYSFSLQGASLDRAASICIETGVKFVAFYYFATELLVRPFAEITSRQTLLNLLALLYADNENE